MFKVRFFGPLLCLLLLGSCKPASHPITLKPPPINHKNVIQVPITHVIDGDTIKVTLYGREETVRILLIDTPETHHPKLGVQPYGPEAFAETKRILEGKQVTLELAENEARDKYGRLLAYLFVGDQSVEVDLLEKGLARVAYVFPPNTKYLKTYRLAESIAKRNRIGVWKRSGYAKADGFHPEAMKSSSIESPSNSSTFGFAPDSKGECGGRIKGNISNHGKIYHVFNDSFYSKTRAERCFNSEEEAVEAGFRSVK